MKNLTIVILLLITSTTSYLAFKEHRSRVAESYNAENIWNLYSACLNPIP